ncbi:MAG: trypsin-like peptidase domain-containing protein [Candidatus Kuenenia sp.]|nr:trypsin-like peptidase domain-containing protein [Candidatus Kuenenia sp.]
MNKKYTKFLPYFFLIIAGLFFYHSTGSLSRDKVEFRPVTPSPGEFSKEEQATIDIFKMTSSSVIYITNKQVRRDLFSLDVFKIPQGAGSGFIWDENGHIVTNFHVIYNANEIDVTLNDGSVWDARLVGVDPDHDIAVLRINAPKTKLIPVLIGTSSDLQVGQKVLALGNPFGLDLTLTTGIISALGRTIEAMTGRTIFDVIQTDAAINPGNSGGPLLDSFGRVIGMNTSIISPSGASTGIGFAVPIDTINRNVSQLIAMGKVERPGLGITLVPNNITKRLEIQGACLLEVIPNGAADKAGLQGTKRNRTGSLLLGDVIIEVEGNRVNNSEDLIKELSRYKVGDSVALKVLRDKNIMEKRIKLQPIDSK